MVSGAYASVSSFGMNVANSDLWYLLWYFPKPPAVPNARRVAFGNLLLVSDVHGLGERGNPTC